MGLNVDEGDHSDPRVMSWDTEVIEQSTARSNAAERAAKLKAEAKETAESAARAADREKILVVFDAFPDGETKTGIRDASGVRSARFNPVFGELVRDGELVPCKISKGNQREYDGYRRNGTGTRTQSVPLQSHTPGRPPL